MRHITDTPKALRATRPGQVRARVAVMDDGRAKAFKILRLMLPLALLFFLALGQAASAHQAGSQHEPHAVHTISHHAKAGIACCGGLSQDGKACLAQCLASCSYCAPLPLPTAFPDLATFSPAPARTEPLYGAIASPHLRPPSLS
ncbi:hypothetical protein [Aminobacter sp. HY435]|uniref:hypothetical protein n=1 Tax=Aminobacter sp. HY435 TaxID=2970917 RepID=UPI0022B9C45B|nr:hypothetical protein [Aminobacter sp. HY435]